MTADLALSPLLSAFAAVLSEQTAHACYAAGVPADATPDSPYLVVWPVGGRWDQGPLEQGVSAANYGLQVDGVGRSELDVAWILDQARQVLLHFRPIAGPGWSVAGCVSEGPPLPTEGERLLRYSQERYDVYVVAG